VRVFVLEERQLAPPFLQSMILTASFCTGERRKRKT
jgi:hypothetical protein